MFRQKKKICRSWLFVLLIGMLCVSGCGSELSDLDETAQKISEKSEQIQKLVLGDKTMEVESVSQGKYVYETLPASVQTVYDEILFAILSLREEIQISTTDLEEMEQAYEAIRADYCNLFWLDNLSYVTYRREDEITAIKVVPVYSMTREEKEDMQQQVDAEAERMLGDAPVQGSDFDKVLYVYETLIREVNYVTECPENQNIISAFVYHETICQGYAYATQYLLEKLGIPCVTVTGTARGESHAWNLVQMDGDYYYVDTTWGNSQYIYRSSSQDSQTGAAEGKYIDYDYMGATTESMERTHQSDVEFPLPECTSIENTYYVHEGCYVSTWDPELIAEMIIAGRDSEEKTAQIKFSDEELFEQAIEYYIEREHLSEFCKDGQKVHYMENSDNNVLLLKF